jgi:ElaA protein
VNLTYEIKHFKELSTLEYHNLLKLRVEVFVIEQNCPYPEVDGIDPFSFVSKK